ncbi:hypothetical protein OHQ88_33575 (plasmid) [Micromonospora zamorensis]|uniref:hypothetical protein n=1 Tax=Micromonospora zamorensis TaxID=709883 RepID=UPI002E1D9E82
MTPLAAVSDRAPEIPPADLATALRDTTANLAPYIEQRAQEIGAPRIGEIEQDAADRVAAAEAERDVTTRRFADVEREFRRQYAALEARRDELAWAARYLPAGLRGFVLRSDAGRHLYPQPRESFAAAVDQAAAKLDLTPYAEEDR